MGTLQIGQIVRQELSLKWDKRKKHEINIKQKTDFSDRTPFMPTSRKWKVKQANVVSLNPLIIRLLYDSEKYVQEVSVGADLGSKHVGISVATEITEFLDLDRMSPRKLRTGEVDGIAKHVLTTEKKERDG